MKKFVLMLSAIAFLGVATHFLTSFTDAEEKGNLSPVTIYFDGDPLDLNAVKNAANWSADNPENDCPAGTRQACAMSVQPTDLKSNGELDPAKITLGASGNPTQGYVPTRTGGSGSIPTFHNRN